MRKMMTSAIVLSLLAGSPAFAQNDNKQERQAARAEAREQRQDAKRAQPAAKPQQRAQAQRQDAHQQQRVQAQRQDARQDRAQAQRQDARQPQRVQEGRQDARQEQRVEQRQRTQARPQVQRAQTQALRRWDRQQDRAWYQSRWNGRARNFDARVYRRAFNAPRRYSIGAYYAPPGWTYRRYNVGGRFPLDWLIASIFINNWTAYGLASPPWGYEWVRSGPDALLVDVQTGEVLQVEYSVFY